MAYSDAWGGSIAGDASVGPGATATEKALGGKSKLIGILIVITLAQVFFYLVAVDQSPLLPSSFASYEPEMLFYIVLMTAVVLPVVGFAPAIHTSREAVNLATGGSVFRFMATYAITGFLAWTLMSLVLTGLHASYAMVSGADRLGLIIVEVFFVSVAEECCFRMALPLVMNWVLASCFLFAIFHLPVDALTIGLGNITQIASAFVQRFLAGLVLFIIYRYAGLGAAASSHAIYDLILTGGIGSGFPIGLVHNGLVPV
jgi:hypothetical protein